MSKSMNKLIAKEEYQAKVNPKHKTAYVQPLRPRSTVFKSKKDYNRQTMKAETRRAVNAW